MISIFISSLYVFRLNVDGTAIELYYVVPLNSEPGVCSSMSQIRVFIASTFFMTNLGNMEIMTIDVNMELMVN